METWLLLPVILGGITLILWLLSSPFHWTTRKVKHLTPLPIFGNSLRLIILGKESFVQYLYDKFPGEKYFGFHMFTRPALFVRDLDLINNIFVSSFDHFSSRGFYSNQHRDSGGGNLFHIYGQQWKEMRGKLSPYFTTAKVKDMLKCAETTLLRVNRIIDENRMDNQPIEMLHIFKKASIDVTTQSIFGIESDVFEKNSQFVVLSNQLSSTSLNMRLFLSLLSPKIYDFFKCTVFGQIFEKFVTGIIIKTMEYRKKENKFRPDFLQGMMELLETKQETTEKYFADNTIVPKYDLNTILSQSMILFGGAFETTMLSMSYCLHELALHPDIQEACREEVLSVIQENNCAEITTELAHDLPYLTAVIKESLRVHPLFGFYGRECTIDFKVPDSEFTIEKGTFIILSQKRLHMDEKCFPEPNQFRPERFLSEGHSGSKTGLYIPFGLGPKMCIGTSYARILMNLVLSRLLQKYKFTVCHKTEIPIKNATHAFLTTPANGIWVNVEDYQ